MAETEHDSQAAALSEQILQFSHIFNIVRGDRTEGLCQFMLLCGIRVASSRLH
jgi:hypothetical protein